MNEFGKDKFEIVVPSLSILAEPPVAVVDKVVDKKGTRAAAEAYLKFLYTPEGQEIAAKNYYRPRDANVAKKYEGSFTKVELFTIDERVRRLEEGADHALQGWRSIRRHLCAVIERESACALT